MDLTPVINGLILATLAGLSTTIGALGIYFIKAESRFISIAMGFSAGVMIGVSMLELLPSALFEIGLFKAGISFILGLLAVSILDILIPHDYMHEHSCDDEESNRFNGTKNRLGRTGRLVAVGIAIYNLPEGFITLSGAFYSTELGILLAVAISMHNIPEGLSVAVPIYASTNDKREAFKISFLSGLAEPLGAIIATVVLLTFGLTTDEFIQMALAFVAGIMLFISLDELLPSARETCKENESDSHIVTLGIIAGVTVIFLTLVALT
ncbi:zinc transporter ZupT [Candidatus Heimdallarchaeota archaeon B3_Heim]|nr:MAG: zinc transporter ZupT [Candidatus Heimdallarchaeota archaeon B3_Heim]